MSFPPDDEARRPTLLCVLAEHGHDQEWADRYARAYARLHAEGASFLDCRVRAHHEADGAPHEGATA